MNTFLVLTTQMPLTDTVLRERSQGEEAFCDSVHRVNFKGRSSVLLDGRGCGRGLWGLQKLLWL